MKKIKPVKPAKPTKPTKPAKPIKPTKPVKPVKKAKERPFCEQVWDLRGGGMSIKAIAKKLHVSDRRVSRIVMPANPPPMSGSECMHEYDYKRIADSRRIGVVDGKYGKVEVREWKSPIARAPIKPKRKVHKKCCVDVMRDLMGESGLKTHILDMYFRGMTIKAIAKAVHKRDRFVSRVVHSR